MFDFISDLTFGQWMILGLIFFVVNLLSEKVARIIVSRFPFLQKKKGENDQ